MTAHQETARRVAGIFFAAWLLLALAIADFPPPPGFVILDPSSARGQVAV
jgi:hypothetical protein